LALSGQIGLQKFALGREKTYNCHNFGSTNWNGVLQSCSPVNVNMFYPNINSSGPSESASRAPTLKSAKTVMSASHSHECSQDFKCQCMCSRYKTRQGLLAVHRVYIPHNNWLWLLSWGCGWFVVCSLVLSGSTPQAACPLQPFGALCFAC
jgi:hypothetical protein